MLQNITRYAKKNKRIKYYKKLCKVDNKHFNQMLKKYFFARSKAKVNFTNINMKYLWFTLF